MLVKSTVGAELNSSWVQATAYQQDYLVSTAKSLAGRTQVGMAINNST